MGSGQFVKLPGIFGGAIWTLLSLPSADDYIWFLYKTVVLLCKGMVWLLQLLGYAYRTCLNSWKEYQARQSGLGAENDLKRYLPRCQRSIPSTPEQIAYLAEKDAKKKADIERKDVHKTVRGSEPCL
jgi:hypothetical protein